MKKNIPEIFAIIIFWIPSLLFFGCSDPIAAEKPEQQHPTRYYFIQTQQLRYNVFSYAYVDKQVSTHLEGESELDLLVKDDIAYASCKDIPEYRSQTIFKFDANSFEPIDSITSTGYDNHGIFSPSSLRPYNNHFVEFGRLHDESVFYGFVRTYTETLKLQDSIVFHESGIRDVLLDGDRLIILVSKWDYATETKNSDLYEFNRFSKTLTFKKRIGSERDDHHTYAQLFLTKNGTILALNAFQTLELNPQTFDIVNVFTWSSLDPFVGAAGPIFALNYIDEKMYFITHAAFMRGKLSSLDLKTGEISHVSDSTYFTGPIAYDNENEIIIANSSKSQVFLMKKDGSTYDVINSPRVLKIKLN